MKADRDIIPTTADMIIQSINIDNLLSVQVSKYIGTYYNFRTMLQHAYVFAVD
jgi:hypothetical protein